MKIRSLDGKTPDIAEENIQKLKKIFPDVFTEDKVDFEKLQQVLGEYVEDRTERYNFTWNGKGRALRLSQTPSLGTLRPCKEEAKDWDTTQNLYIEGDSLEVLKLLQKSYHSKVKMIYIDPPYNTGKDFVYPDDFHDSLENYKRITGQVDDNGNRISTNTEASGRYHTDWLNMMYPRLRLARNLLSDDGVIFISIDDNEVDNLKKICNEVFGEDNFIGCVTRVAKTTSFRGNYLAPSKDYLVCFSKFMENLKPFIDEVDNVSQFNKVEEYGVRKGEKYRDDIAFYLSTLETRPNQRYFIECPDGQKVIPPGNTFPPEKPISGDGVWRWSLDNYNEKKDLIVFKKTNRSPLIDENGNQANWNLYTKSYLNDKLEKGNIPRDIFEGFLNRNGSEDLKTLDIPFSFPKPVKLISYLMKLSCIESNDIVLDFFSGSSTTAHAVMRLNADDGGNRKFIMVQLPETTDEKSEAFKAGYMNICEIGKERIRRAGEKIKEKYKDKENIENLDIGFKVLKLDTSNIRKWQPDYDNLEQSLFDHVDNYMEGRTELDVVYEIMLKYGLDLTYPVDEFTVAQKKVYSIGFGMLMICLDNEITTEVAKGILEKITELAPESTRVVFKDNGLNSDSKKTNIKEILKCGGIEEFITL
ncbi:TPA: site-specific DNA-methyltransferase [Streptococcus suis]